MRHQATNMLRLLSSEQVAERLGFSSRYVRILYGRGHLPGFRAPGGREIKFRPEVIEQFISENESRELHGRKSIEPGNATETRTT